MDRYSKLLLPSSEALKVEVTVSSQTALLVYQRTRYHSPEACNLRKVHVSHCDSFCLGFYI